MSARRIRILGVGMGPQHVTPEVAEALRSVDYVVAAQKSRGRRTIRCSRCDARSAGCTATSPLVAVPDPERDRDAPTRLPGRGRRLARGPGRGVRAGAALAARVTSAFLVWGDPSLYDSTIRIVESIRGAGQRARRVRRAPRHQRPAAAGRPAPDRAARGRAAGARHHRAPAARGGRRGARQHRGDAERATRPRRARGLADLVGRQPRHCPTRRSSRARSATCSATSRSARAAVKDAAGWVMDVYLVRKPASSRRPPGRRHHVRRGQEPRHDRAVPRVRRDAG